MEHLNPVDQARQLAAEVVKRLGQLNLHRRGSVSYTHLKGLLLSEKCQVGARRTLLRHPVKLGARSAESCTRIFVILCRVAASSF